jgi:hypothetical protein
MSEKKMRPGRNGGLLKTGGNTNGGRPKKIPELRQLMADIMGEEGADGTTAMAAVVKRLRQQAIGGNMRAAELLLKYTYGMPKQSVELTGADDKPLFDGLSIKIIK